ncbi:hypothetical protein HDU98_006065, partial [Podochytrium sp. JEL0797]
MDMERKLLRVYFRTSAALANYQSQYRDWSEILKSQPIQTQHAFTSTLAIDIYSIGSDFKLCIDYGILAPAGTTDTELLASLRPRNNWDVQLQVDSHQAAPSTGKSRQQATKLIKRGAKPQHKTIPDNSKNPRPRAATNENLSEYEKHVPPPALPEPFLQEVRQDASDNMKSPTASVKLAAPPQKCSDA